MSLVPVVLKGHGHCLLRTGFVTDIGCNSWEPPLHFRHPINSAPDGMEERDRKEKKVVSCWACMGMAWQY
jgi:hypothetical protein